MPRKFLVLPILFILFSAAIFPYSYASPESEAAEDIAAGCRDGQTLVYRSTYKDFVCLEPSTADRWEQLGMAEIIKESDKKTDTPVSESDVISYEEKYPGAPPPPPTKSTTTDIDSQCRDGQILIYRFTHHDTFCTNKFTAITWERLGMAEILDNEKPSEIVVDSTPIHKVEPIEESLAKDEPEPIEESLAKDEPEQNNTLSEFDSIKHIDFPKIYPIGSNIWAVVDHDKSSSVLIEGDSGIIMIDSLTSYQSMKKALDDFKKISDKNIKIIIFTTISSESVFASSAVTSTGFDKIEMILSNELLSLYYEDNDLNIENVVAFNAQQSFSINVGGVEIDLISFDGIDSEQTYISLPEYGSMLIGDSKNGVFPVILDIDDMAIFMGHTLSKSNNNE